MKSSPTVYLVASLVFALALTSSNSISSQFAAATATAAEKANLTSTLIAWISSQCEKMIEEMEAIAKYNSESNSFSLVNYLRYLYLYDNLDVVARVQVDDLKWIRRKAKAFSKINAAAEEIVLNYLLDLDSALTKLELAEPKSKQTKVGAKWLELYQTIRYIATHSPRKSVLLKTAYEKLQTSPDGSVDRKRSNRFELATHAFN